MKFSIDVNIQVPRPRVIELFDNADNLGNWQDGFKSLTYLEGEEGKPGAKSSIVYEEKGREVELIETIITRNLPLEFSAKYSTKGVENVVVNKFYEEEGNKTHWNLEAEFQFSGFMRVMAFFMKGSFKKQTLKDMNNFKRFAEKQ